MRLFSDFCDFHKSYSICEVTVPNMGPLSENRCHGSTYEHFKNVKSYFKTHEPSFKIKSYSSSSNK